jgi:hypothetical protein
MIFCVPIQMRDFSKVLEGGELKKRTDFFIHGIRPFCVAIFVVQVNCFFNITRYLNTKFIDRTFTTFTFGDIILMHHCPKLLSRSAAIGLSLFQPGVVSRLRSFAYLARVIGSSVIISCKGSYDCYPSSH